MKVWSYTVIAITMLLFFHFAGMPTALDGMFEFIGIGFDADGGLNQTEFSTSNLSNYLLPDVSLSDTGDDVGWLTILLGGVVALGLVATGRSDIAIKAAFAAAVLFSFVTSLYFVVTHAIEIGIALWAVSILGVIFIPFTAGYIIALVYFVAGGTSD